jgi:hypothetical protein
LATASAQLKGIFKQLGEIEEWLTTPASKNLPADIIRQSRLLAGMLLVLIGLGLIVEIPTI